MFHSGEGSSRVSRMKIPRRIFLRALPPRPVAAAAAIAAAIEASESFFGNPIGSTKGEEKNEENPNGRTPADAEGATQPEPRKDSSDRSACRRKGRSGGQRHPPLWAMCA